MNKPARILRNENNKFEEKLSKETNDVLTDIVVYIRSTSISEYDQERVRRDIDEMLFEGERRGMSAAEIIGDDYKAFCDAVMCEVPKLSKAQRVMTAVQEVLAGVIVLLDLDRVLSHHSAHQKGALVSSTPQTFRPHHGNGDSRCGGAGGGLHNQKRFHAEACCTHSGICPCGGDRYCRNTLLLRHYAYEYSHCRGYCAAGCAGACLSPHREKT